MKKRFQREVGLYCIAEIEKAAPLTYSFFKIGISNNAEARLRSLQTSSPRRLALLVVEWFRSVNDARKAEQATHSYLSGATVRGEWFSFNDGCPFEAMSVAGIGQVDYIPRSDFYMEFPEPSYDPVLLTEPERFSGRAFK